MEKTIDSSSQFTQRHLSQIKVLSRLLEHELELAKGEEVVLEKPLLENVLDTLEIFIEDIDTKSGGRPAVERKAVAGEAKPQVTRLN
ncbi:MAG: hypothetical protein ACE5F1_03110 [Planctomycetota bacterium]